MIRPLSLAPSASVDPADPSRWRLSGDWTLAHAREIETVLAKAPEEITALDAREVGALDSSGALQLVRFADERQWPRERFTCHDHHRALLDAVAAAGHAPSALPHRETGFTDALARLGQAIYRKGQEASALASFFGELLVGLARLALQPQRLRLTATIHHMEQVGLDAVPLVAVLFIANVMFPLFLPGEMVIDKFIRALVAVALFTSAYIAEVIRGGLQAVPPSQYEAARALGLGGWRTTLLVVLPQAYRLVVPAIVNTLIGMFKDTSLVYIISMYDLLGIIRTVSLQAKWITPQTPATAFMFAGLIYWIFCFAMSHYGRYIERRLNKPHHK